MPFIVPAFFALILLAALAISLVILFWARRQATEGVVERHGGRGLPICGGCGYAVRGVSTLACPECGADLREVGIIPPGYRGSSRAVLLVMWSLAMLILSAIVFPLITQTAAPLQTQINHHIQFRLTGTSAGSGIQAELEAAANHWRMPWAGIPASMAMDHAHFELLSVSSPQPAIQFDHHQGQWQIAPTGSNPATPLSASVLVPWLINQGQLGQPEADALAQEIIQELIGLRTIPGHLTTANGPQSMSSRGSSSRWVNHNPQQQLTTQRNSTTYIGPAPAFVLGVAVLAISIWAFGVRRIAKRGKPTANKSDGLH